MAQTDRYAHAFPSQFAYALALLALVLMIVAQTVISIDEDRDNVLSVAKENQRLSLRMLEEHAWRSLQDAVHVLNSTSLELNQASNPVFRDQHLLNKILQNEKQEQALLYELSLIEQPAALSDTQQEGKASFDKRLGFLQARKKLLHDGEIIWGPAYPSAARDGLILPVVKVMKSSLSGGFRYLLLELRLNYFSEFYSRLALEQDSHVALHDSQGAILASFPASRGVGASELPASLFTYRANNTTPEAYFEGNLAGQVDCLIAYRSLSHYPFALVLAQPKQRLLIGWQQRTLRKLVLVSLTLTIIAVLSYSLLKQFRRTRRSRAQLEAVDNRYKLLFDSAKDAILLIGRDYTYIDCNPASLKIFAVASKQDIIGRRVGSFSVGRETAQNLTTPSNENLVIELINRAFEGESLNFEWQLNQNGQISYCEVALNRVYIKGVAYLYSIIREVNDRHYSEKLLSGQNHILHLLSSNHNLSEILLEICAFVESFNPNWVCGIQILNDDKRSFASCVGGNFPALLQKQIPGLSLTHGNGIWCGAVLHAQPVNSLDLIHSPAMQFVNGIEALAHYLQGIAWPITGKNGQVLGSMTVLSSQTDAPVQRDLSVFSIAVDVSGIAIEGRRSENKILRLAHYDDLTGLPNRFLYNQHLAKALALAERNGSRLAVLFLDLDRFKNINDTFGHDAGDHVLETVSRNFRNCLRESDVVARIGGDEFILLIENFQDVRDLSEVAGKLLHEASRPFEISGQECQLSASIGIATFPNDGKDAQTLLKNADIAMYKAKHRGKDNYQFYAAEMNVHSVERMAFEARLRKALERREFIVHYQPKLSIATGKIIGAEALVRWNHPEKGILSPGEFIAMAEEAGLIARLGMLVLDITCRDILSFRQVDKQFGRIAINLSGTQFNDPHLLEELRSVVDFWRVPVNSIEFEITESMVMHNQEQAIILMDGLKQAGFTLSIDDFGTGYSSLAYLKRFPVDSLKVDRSFIRDIPDDPNDTAIVKAIVAMAHTLGIHVVAEGVESASQLDTLASFDCDWYQGYYFSRAVSDKEFLQLLQKQKNNKS